MSTQAPLLPAPLEHIPGMTFEEWWGGDRDRTLAYDLMKVLTEAARQAWDAGHATSIEEMLEKWNRTGVDIDAALHGRMNEQSPIANRLRMIAAMAKATKSDIAAELAWRDKQIAELTARTAFLEANAPVGSWTWLRGVIKGIPTTEAYLGGQRTKYVQRGEVLDWLDVGEERTEKPAVRSAEDTERLDWLFQKLSGDAIRCCVGELSDTCDGDEFRAAIDAAMGVSHHG